MTAANVTSLNLKLWQKSIDSLTSKVLDNRIALDYPLAQGSPTPGASDQHHSAAQREVSGGRASFICSPSLALPPEPSLPPHPRPSHPHQWKNSLPWNRSLVPERLGTAALADREGPVHWPKLRAVLKLVHVACLAKVQTDYREKQLGCRN